MKLIKTYKPTHLTFGKHTKFSYNLKAYTHSGRDTGYLKPSAYMYRQSEFLKSIYRISDRGEPWEPYEKEVADGELIRLTPSINQEMNQ